MKYLNLFVLALAFVSSNLSAQIIFNALSDEDICENVTLAFNGTDLSEDNCQFSTDFSNVQSGVNTLEITTDLSPLAYTSTLDLVLVMKKIDEGFESYAEAMAADFDNDMIISTDDIIKMRRVILGIESDIPTKVKLATVDQVFEPMTSLELLSDHTSLELNDTDIQDGTGSEIFVVIVGHISN